MSAMGGKRTLIFRLWTIVDEFLGGIMRRSMPRRESGQQELHRFVEFLVG